MNPFAYADDVATDPIQFGREFLPVGDRPFRPCLEAVSIADAVDVLVPEVGEHRLTQRGTVHLHVSPDLRVQRDGFAAIPLVDDDSLPSLFD